MEQTTSPSSKTCVACEQHKALSDFRFNTDGKYSWYERKCKRCASAASYAKRDPERVKQQKREHRQRHLDELRAYDRKRFQEDPSRRQKTIESVKAREATEAGKSRKLAYARRIRAERPEQYRAQYTMANAIRDGRLERGPCGHCGTNIGVQGHHHDYSKPLDVAWLCKSCHMAEHRQQREQERSATCAP